MNTNGTVIEAETQLATLQQASSEIIEAEVVPRFGITLDEAQRRVEELKAFVRSQMVEGEDYGIIPGTKKPSLWKPGAEKLNMMFGLAPVIEVLDKTVCYGNIEGEKPFAAYEIKVRLINKRDGRVEAEGVGSANTGEKRYRNQNALDVANTVFKIAKKRALVDATLSATRASGIFTQDVEDMAPEPQQHSRQLARHQRPQHQRPQQAARRPQSREYTEVGDVSNAETKWLRDMLAWLKKNEPANPDKRRIVDELNRRKAERRQQADTGDPDAAEAVDGELPVDVLDAQMLASEGYRAFLDAVERHGLEWNTSAATARFLDATTRLTGQLATLDSLDAEEWSELAMQIDEGALTW